MKKFLYVALGVLLFTSCAKDESHSIEDNTSADLTTMLPNPNHDNAQQGVYSGVIVANDAQFHGKLFLDIANNSSRYQALVETIEGQRFVFALTNKVGSIYTFSSTKGTFTVDISNHDNVVITDISIDNNAGSARLIKNVNNRRAAIVLGSYNSQCTSCPAPQNGTWDFLVDPVTPTNVFEVIVTTGNNEMKIDNEFEGTTPYCYGGGPYIPFFFEDLEPTVNEFELYVTNQFWVLGSGNILTYDVAFSKNILDSNSLAYSGMVGHPEITNSLFFDPPLDPAGCRYLTGTAPLQGFYGLYNPAGDMLLDAGYVSFDTSGFVPVPPPPPLSAEGIEIDTVVAGEPQL